MGLSSNPGRLCPTPCVNLEVSPHIAKCPLRDRISLTENTSLRGRQTCAMMWGVCPQKGQGGMVGRMSPCGGYSLLSQHPLGAGKAGLSCNVTPQRPLCSHPWLFSCHPVLYIVKWQSSGLKFKTCCVLIWLALQTESRSGRTLHSTGCFTTMSLFWGGVWQVLEVQDAACQWEGDDSQLRCSVQSHPCLLGARPLRVGCSSSQLEHR